jgi:hypothetical protein
MMARHLSDEALLLTLEGNTPASAHLDACPDCAGRLAEATGGFDLARAAHMPEPSPLYWEAFRHQVGRRIEMDGAGPSGSWRWAWMPLLAAAAVAVVVAIPFWKAPLATPAPVLPAWSALPPADQDDGLAVLEGVDLAAADLPAVTDERGVAEALADLSDDEAHAVEAALGPRPEGQL